MVVADGAVALEDASDDPLAILDELQAPDEIVVVTRRRVLQAADAAVEARRDRADIDTVGVLDQVDALGIERGGKMDVSRNQGVDPRHRVGDRGDLESIEVRPVAPVVRVAHVGRAHSGLEGFEEERSRPDPLAEVLGVLLDDLGLLFRQLRRQIGVRAAENRPDGMAVELVPADNIGEESLDHRRRVVAEVPVHAPYHFIGREGRAVMKLDTLADLERELGGIGVDRPFFRELRMDDHVIEHLGQVVVARPAAGVVDSRREDDGVHLIVRTMEVAGIDRRTALHGRFRQCFGTRQISLCSRSREPEGPMAVRKSRRLIPSSRYFCCNVLISFMCCLPYVQQYFVRLPWRYPH